MKGYAVTLAGMDHALAAIHQLTGDLPGRASADAINHTANQIRQELQGEMASVFDRPTPWVLKSVMIKNATPGRLEAKLWFKEPPTKGKGYIDQDDWVLPQVEGKERRVKNVEAALRRHLRLPADKYIVPGAGARLDAYGNISRGHMAQLLSGLKAAESRAGYTANASDSWRSFRKGHEQAFFVIKRGKTPIGIAERRGKQMKVVLAFVSKPAYTQRLDFYGIATRVTAERLPANLDKALLDALGRGTGTLPTRFDRRR